MLGLTVKEKVRIHIVEGLESTLGTRVKLLTYIYDGMVACFVYAEYARDDVDPANHDPGINH